MAVKVKVTNMVIGFSRVCMWEDLMLWSIGGNPVKRASCPLIDCCQAEEADEGHETQDRLCTMDVREQDQLEF